MSASMFDATVSVVLSGQGSTPLSAPTTVAVSIEVTRPSDENPMYWHLFHIPATLLCLIQPFLASLVTLLLLLRKMRIIIFENPGDAWGYCWLHDSSPGQYFPHP